MQFPLRPRNFDDFARELAGSNPDVVTVRTSSRSTHRRWMSDTALRSRSHIQYVGLFRPYANEQDPRNDVLTSSLKFREHITHTVDALWARADVTSLLEIHLPTPAGMTDQIARQRAVGVVLGSRLVQLDTLGVRYELEGPYGSRPQDVERYKELASFMDEHVDTH